MPKIVLNNVANLENQTSAVAVINNNSDAIETAFENTLSRDGTSPNSMGATLDMNSNRIINIPEPISNSEPVRLADIVEIQNAVNSLDSAVAQAELAAEEAAGFLAQTQDVYDTFDDTFLGAKSSQPSVDNDGDPLVAGQLYFNTSTDALNIYDGSSWLAYSAASGLTAVADDTSPSLGGDLDLNSNDIEGTGNINITGDVSLSGSIELGHASDTTIARESSGVISVEGNEVLTTVTGQPLDATLTALAAYNTNGLLTQTTGDTFVGRTITGTANKITVTNGSGVGGNPTLTIPDAVVLVTPALGTPASGTLTSCAGLPAAGVVNTALVVSVEDQGPITGGASTTPKDLGTITTGTVTPDAGDRAMQYYTNGGAHTLGEMSTTGVVYLLITNNSSAGAITTSAWDRVEGDSFTTTDTHKFECVMRRWPSNYSILTVRALQ